jgi:hypothetical protein
MSVVLNLLPAEVPYVQAQVAVIELREPLADEDAVGLLFVFIEGVVYQTVNE